jgi:DNA invertase Pin-like site-specific DNA recombinase
MPLYGYARVSTRDQDLAPQLNELTAAGCAQVFKEKVSGARSDRPELAKVIGRLEPGDVLVVTRLDRLARSTRDLLNVLDELAKRGAGFRSLKDSWADTTTPHGKLMVTVLGGLAEFERELIRARTGEGRKRAKERGVRFGRPRKMTPTTAGNPFTVLRPAKRRPHGITQTRKLLARARASPAATRD